MARKHNSGVGAGAFPSHLENSKIENSALEIELKLHSGESGCHDSFFIHSTDARSSLPTTLSVFSISFTCRAGALSSLTNLLEILLKS